MTARPWHNEYDVGVPTNVSWDPMRLDQLLHETAVAHPEHAAIIFYDRKISYGELDDLVDRLAAALQDLGVVPGDRVSLFMPNCPQLIIAYHAAWRAGAIAVPSNPLYTATEFGHQAADAGSKVAIVLSLLYPKVQAARARTELEHVLVTNIKEYFKGPTRALFTLLRERKDGHRIDIGDDPDTSWFYDRVARPRTPQHVATGPGDTAMLMYTGGTTGVPKGAELTHDNLVANVHQVNAFAPDLRDLEESVLLALPLTHSYALTVGAHLAILRAGTMIIVPDPRDMVGLLKVIDAHRPTVFPGVPTLYGAISRHRHVAAGKYDVRSINICLSGAAALPPEIQRHFEDATGARLVEGYGLSEASPVTHCNPLGGEDRVGFIGVPLSGTDAKIVDEETERITLGPGERGVLCVSGPQVMRGYWNMPDETAIALHTDDNGAVWLHTGDVAVMDETGWFRIVDRKKDMILASGGFNVYPREIEDVLYEHPDVVDAGVIGVPVGGENQRGKAFVVLAPGSQATAEDLLDFCRERLARFKIPHTVEIRDELPKSFVGKVLRRELAAEEQARHGIA
jgi:long-chain acyl-CoA synthetase